MALPMALPADMFADVNVPTYIIYRETRPGEAFDPTAPPVFFPPKDSDELFDALRAKFPHVKSHSERMRDAMIEFLIEERWVAQSGQVPVTAADLADPFLPMDAPTASPGQPSWPSTSSGSASVFSSPDTLDLATPSFSVSPRMPVPQLTRFSTTTSTTAPSPTSPNITSFGSTSSGPSPPALEHMTGVFSVSASAQPKQRIRRKMTEAEKAEYRKRRIVKACDKCQKRKRKCTHNQPEMEHLAATQKVKKTTDKPRQQARTTKQPLWAGEADVMQLDDIFDFDPTMFTTDMQLFDDDFTLWKEPYSVDQQWSNQQLGMTSDVGRGGWAPGRQTQDDDHRLGLDDHPLAGGPSTQVTTGGRNLQTATGMNSANANNALPFGQTSQQSQEHHRYHITGLDSRHTGGKGNRILWEPVRTGQVDPTHTGHVHNAERAGSYFFDPDGISLGANPRLQRPSWPQTVLQLTGTLRAIKAFGKLSSSRKTRDSPQPVSINRIASVISDVRAKPDGGLQSNAHAHDTDPMNATTVPKIFRPARASARAGAPSSWARGHGRPDGIRLEISNGLLDTAHDRLFDGRSRSSKELTTASVSVSPGSESLFEKESDPAHQQGRPLGTLGEGIDRMPSPTRQMFMLERRLPKALHSVVERNNPLRGTVNGTKANVQSASAHATANCAVHTRLAVPTLSGYSVISHADTATDAAIQSRRSAAASVGKTDANAVLQQPNSTTAHVKPVADRLSYHVTHRDHFGRPTTSSAHSAAAPGHGPQALGLGWSSLPMLLVVVALLLAVSLFHRHTDISTSLLRLALASPCAVSTKPIRCTEKNSLWLASRSRQDRGQWEEKKKKEKGSDGKRWWSPSMWLRGAVWMRC